MVSEIGIKIQNKFDDLLGFDSNFIFFLVEYLGKRER